MARRRSFLVVSLAAGPLLLALGCATSDSNDVGMGEGNLTPESAKNLEEQRNLCIDRVKENGSQRKTDLAAGVVRWKCGDVKGVNNKAPNPSGKPEGAACTFATARDCKSLRCQVAKPDDTSGK